MSEFTAVWCPTWYDQDQPVAVGRREARSFFVSADEYIRAEIKRRHSQLPDAIFFCGAPADGLWFDVRAEILSMTNSALGQVVSITSQGLHYTVTLDSGRQLIVNCEEHPGAVWDTKRKLWLHEFEQQDWTMTARINQH